MAADSVSSIISYVIKWVEDRYEDDECLSIALFTVNNCLVYGRPKDSYLSYVMRSVINSIQSYLSEPKTNPLPPDIVYTEVKNDIPYDILTLAEQICIKLKFEQNYTARDIAERTDLTYSTVRYRLATALNKLRFYYERENSTELNEAR